MTHQEYADHVEEFLREMKKVTTEKNADYSAGTADAMHDYHASAECAQIDPLQAWLVLYLKHFHAVLRFVKTHSVSSENIHGRFIDLANYAMLADALVKDMEADRSAAWDNPTTTMPPPETDGQWEKEIVWLVGIIKAILERGELRGDHHNVKNLYDLFAQKSMVQSEMTLRKFMGKHYQMTESVYIGYLLQMLEGEVQ